MARLPKKKPHPKRSSQKTSSKSELKHSKATFSSDEILQEQVLALGGTQDDLNLLKSAGKDTTLGIAKDDPALANDVSQFLKELNLDIGNSQETQSQQSTKSQKEVKKQEEPYPQSNSSRSQKRIPSMHDKSTLIDKKQKKSAPQLLHTSAKPEPVTGAPKAQPPEKVSNPRSSFVSQPTPLWHTSIPPLTLPSTPVLSITPTLLSSLIEKASKLHNADVHIFHASSSSPSESRFFTKIIQSGTLSDRLSALTLLVQNSPLHNIQALEVLKGMSERGKGKGGRDESLKALRCVVDWWVGGGAPDRKLRYFRDQPLTHSDVTDECLLVWYFEDWLKKYFFSILQILETLSLDPLPYIRTQSLTLIFTLLRDKPEQEQNLLRLLVNKLGDNEKSICSRASYYLLQLLQSHPSMKSVIIREIITLVLRPPSLPAPEHSSHPEARTEKHIRFADVDKPNTKLKLKPRIKTKPKPMDKKAVNVHARYYATITFNQIVLAPEDRAIALKLIDVYFEMFKELLGEGVEKNTADIEEENEEGQDEGIKVAKDKKGRVIDMSVGRKGKGKKGKGKDREVRGAAGFAEVEDANSKLITAILTGVNRGLPFARVNAGDIGLNKHIDTLFLITHTSTFNISLQALVLIQQISTSFMASTSASVSSSLSKSITDRYYRTLYASLHDQRLAASSKQAMYLNLLFKSLKADAGNADGERIKSFVRRFVQVLVSGGGGATEFVAGGLFLLGELFSTIPGLRSLITEPAKSDVEVYDPRKRDPRYAHASSSPLWELTPLLHHYHPAIALHARQLLSLQPLTASADLSQNTLSHFLDRFVYKNPKQVKSGEGNGNGRAKGASAMQPAASGWEGGGVKLRKGLVDDEGGVRMNEERFLKKRVEDVPVDQLFYHRYFSRKNEKEKARTAKAGKRKAQSDGGDEDEDIDKEDRAQGGGDESEDEEGSELDEDEVWKAMKGSMPNTAGDDDDLAEDDSDDLPSEFDMDDGDAEGNEDESEDENEGDQQQDLGDDIEVEGEDSDDGLSLVEGSDNEDLIPLDGDGLEGLIEWDGSDIGGTEDKGVEEWGGLDAGGSKKRKRGEMSKEKRKKLRSLPTFASYEDYAKMIEEGPEDDI